MKDNLFDTSNLFIASYLLAKGKIIKGKKQNRNLTSVLFDKKEECEKLELDYFNGGTIEANKFAESYLTLRKMVRREE